MTRSHGRCPKGERLRMGFPHGHRKTTTLVAGLRMNVHHKPRLLSDNGPCYIAGELAKYIEAQRMSHVRGAPFHRQTQGKIERWHQTMKNRILLENYFLPGDLETQIEAFVEHYNHRRYHESLKNVTPADAYFGRASDIIKQRERIKRQTIEHLRLQHRKLAANINPQTRPALR